MAKSDYAARIAELLRQVENNISSIPGSDNCKYAALGRLQEVRNLLGRGEAREKRENDAPELTRQETPQAPKNKRSKKKGKANQGSEPGTGDTASDTRQESEEPGATQGNPHERRWTTVVKKGNKEKPGNVDLGKGKAAESSPSCSATPLSSFPKSDSTPGGRPAEPIPPREGGTVRFRINRESEWTTRFKMDGEELVEEITKAAGEGIANMSVGIQVYRGGDIKIWPTPYARATLEDISWVKKWIPSAVAPKKEYDLLITRVPVKGTAEEMATEIERANRNSNFGQPLQISRAMWKERNLKGLQTASLRIMVPTVELADRLIINGVGIKRKHFRVRRFMKNFQPWREYRALFGKVGEGASPPSSEDDRLLTDEDIVFSSSSEATQDPTTKRKMLDPVLPARKNLRGRPIGALNKPKFVSEPVRGENPFKIAEVSSQPGDEVGSVPDTQMTQC